MNITSAISLLNSIIHFVIKNNLAEYSNNDKAAKVVSLKSLEKHLKHEKNEEFINMLKEFGELFVFLMKQGRFIANEKLDKQWTYTVMPGIAYEQYLSQNEHQLFPPLIKPHFYSFNLFLLYQEPEAINYHGTKEDLNKATQKLSNEIRKLHEELSFLKKDNATIIEIKDFLTEEFQEIFDESELKIEQIGTSGVISALFEDFLSLTIRVPKNDIREIRNNNIRDVYYVADRLLELGMKATIPTPQGKRTFFKDPVSKYQCAISVDDGLIYERNGLITEYLKLDNRIEQLVTAIVYFSKSQKINRSVNLSALNSYSYIFMLLHFLINVKEKPMIPNLQKKISHCNSPTCMYNMNKEPIAHDNKVQKVNIRYHTCICIIHIRDAYNYSDSNENHTVWYSDNDDNLGSLLIEFMDYYSRTKHYREISITPPGNISFIDCQKEWQAGCLWIQDPFLTQKNMGGNCKFLPLKKMTKIFNLAAADLKRGYSFREICDLQY